MKKSHGLQGLPDDTEQATAQPSSASAQSVILAPHRQDHGLQGVTDDTEQAEAQHDPASVQSHNPRQSVMLTPPGYKQTEVGVIPEDWEVITLGKGLTSRPSYGVNAPAAAYSDRLPTYIRITDIDGDGHFAPSAPVSVNSPNIAGHYLEEGDIVFARTGASVGKSYLYQPADGRLVYAGFLICIHPDSTNLHAPYVAVFARTGT